MSHITLTGTTLFKVSIESGSSGPFCLLRMRSDYSVPAREAMDWPELPGAANLMDLEEAEIPFGKLTLTSQQQNLDGSQPACLKLQFSTADTFRIVRVKGKKNQSSYVQLRFNVKSLDPTAAAACFEYKRSVKKGMAELVIKWGAAAKEVPAVLTLVQENEPKRISNVDGMKAGSRKKQKEQMAAAVAAEAPTVTVELERITEQVQSIIDQSLN